MTEEELRKNYYADRPSEPYSDDDRPSDWANIAHYAEENIENAFKRIEELGKENAELKKENKELKIVKIPQLERKIASIRGAHSVDCKKLNARTEQVERLKKENAELKAVLYCSRETCDNCGFIDCENFQRQRKSVPCSQYISYKNRLKRLDKEFNVIANEYGKAESKLTRAKEFLNEFMRISKAIDEDFEPDYSELIGETETFLKEYQNDR